MHIITLWEPWATLMALNIKTVETRHWGTKYRGLLAIHAAKRPIDADGIYTLARVSDLLGYDTEKRIALLDLAKGQLGTIKAIARLSDCQRMTPKIIDQQTELERLCGNWQPDRYAWICTDIKGLEEPIPYRGSQGLSEVTDAATLLAIAARYPIT